MKQRASICILAALALTPALTLAAALAAVKPVMNAPKNLPGPLPASVIVVPAQLAVVKAQVPAVTALVKAEITPKLVEPAKLASLFDGSALKVEPSQTFGLPEEELAREIGVEQDQAASAR